MAQQKQPAAEKGQNAPASSDTVKEFPVRGAKSSQSAVGGTETARRALDANAGDVQETAKSAAQAAQEAGRRSADILQFGSRELTHRVQEAAQVWTDMAQNAVRENVEAAQNLLRCRTMTDVLKVQSDWMRNSLEIVLSRTSRLSELSAQLAKESVGQFAAVGKANAGSAQGANERPPR